MAAKQHDILAQLAAPFDPAVVSWRVGSTNKRKFDAKQADKRRGQPLCYIDARDVMERLDAVVGPVMWQNDYTPMPNNTTCCRIGLCIDGEWVWKANGAGATDIEGEKGAYSDAFKRAAVLWGIGRYLYAIETPWIELDDWWRIPKEALGQLNRLLTGEKEPTSRGQRGTGDFERIQSGLRECESVKDLAEFWKAEQAAIAKMSASWRSAITEEKDRCKEVLEARAAAEYAA
jgi:hypothetical protein